MKYKKGKQLTIAEAATVLCKGGKLKFPGTAHDCVFMDNKGTFYGVSAYSGNKHKLYPENYNFSSLFQGDYWNTPYEAIPNTHMPKLEAGMMVEATNKIHGYTKIGIIAKGVGRRIDDTIIVYQNGDFDNVINMIFNRIGYANSFSMFRSKLEENYKEIWSNE